MWNPCATHTGNRNIEIGYHITQTFTSTGRRFVRLKVVGL